jgi:hypothetical protein
METKETFEAWAIVELMGHRRLAGRVSEQVIGGASLLRIDVPEVAEVPASLVDDPYFAGQKRRTQAKPAIPAYSQLYGIGSICCITPTTEEIARKASAAMRERPLSLYDIVPRDLPAIETQILENGRGVDDDPDEDDPEGG